ncbi:hypothetical protein [Nocardiopsis alkaliphila]|uniref:hypothetical protein n=1 Tax=Nocardiopsis alkaliphila TaxID=225762 RepID=UPI0003461AD7|nr:hypothetical protein [Nocardiopsis alkaliphila]
MRRITPYALLLPLVLAAAGCTSPEQEVSLEGPAATSPGEESDPDTTNEGAQDFDASDETEGSSGADGALGFGESAAFPHPVGAYEEEFQDGVAEEVVYTVDEVASDGAGGVEFTLTVEVPELGRVFGLGNMTVDCVYDEVAHTATSDAPVEVETGTHPMDMRCQAPQGAERMTVVMLNGEDEATWAGPLR